MNGKKARACRKVIYGEEGSPRGRKYKFKSGVKTKTVPDRDSHGHVMLGKSGKPITKQIKHRFHILSAGQKRNAYQWLKRLIQCQDPQRSASATQKYLKAEGLKGGC